MLFNYTIREQWRHIFMNQSWCTLKLFWASGTFHTRIFEQIFNASVHVSSEQLCLHLNDITIQTLINVQRNISPLPLVTSFRKYRFWILFNPSSCIIFHGAQRREFWDCFVHSEYMWCCHSAHTLNRLQDCHPAEHMKTASVEELTRSDTELWRSQLSFIYLTIQHRIFSYKHTVLMQVTDKWKKHSLCLLLL